MNNNSCSFIPHKFKLRNKTIKVVIDDDYLKDEKLWGEADFTELIISLCHRSYDNKILDKATKGKVFYHELVHQILNSMGKHKLNEDEDFVDKFGCLLYEYEKTKR